MQEQDDSTSQRSSLAESRGLLASRFGRLTAFFFLYMTEGIPFGFTSIALVALMRESGLGPEEIGAFVATLYLPWSWKWLMGPIVDNVYSHRLGHRRAWIVACQMMMAVTLLLAMRVSFSSQLTWFTLLILLHNVFAATMDVAIDALAVSTLPSQERGAASGLMFAGSYLGSAIGGSGVLYLLSVTSLGASFMLVTISILLVTATISLWLVEGRSERESAEKIPLLTTLYRYVLTLLKACFGSRTSIAALVLAVLPIGAYGLGLSVQSNLAVEFGLDSPAIAQLSLCSTILAAIGCVAGGLLSDRFGRKTMLALYAIATTLPTLWLAYQLSKYGWNLPVKMDPETIPHRDALLMSLWIATCTYSLAQGLMYGARTALFMDVCQAAVAATQFTASMSLMNLALAYSSRWQGTAIERLGYPTTLVIDSGVGLLCLLPLLLITTSSSRFSDSTASSSTSL